MSGNNNFLGSFGGKETEMADLSTVMCELWNTRVLQQVDNKFMYLSRLYKAQGTSGAKAALRSCSI